MMGNLLAQGLRPPMWREHWYTPSQSFLLPVSQELVYGVFR